MIKNLLSLLGMQGINYLIPLLTLPYLTHTLGGFQYGILSTVLILVQYTVIFIDFGFNLSATKKISENRDNNDLVSNIFWNTIFSKLILLVFSTFICFILINSIPKYNSLNTIYILFLPQVIGGAIFPIWLFQGKENIAIITFTTITSKLTTLPLLFLFVKSPADLKVASIILSIPMLLSGLISLLYLKKMGIKKPSNISLKSIFGMIKKSFHYFSGNVAISIYTLSTPLILSLTSDYNQVGLYFAADKLRSAALGIFLILGQAIYPRAIFLLKNNKIQYYVFIKKLFKYQLIICSLCSLLFYSILPPIATLILGKDFSNIEIIIKIMSPMIVFIPTSVILANCIMLPHNKTIAYAFIPWITNTIHLIPAVILCYLYGAVGGSISILITEIISFIFLLTYCYRSKLLKVA